MTAAEIDAGEERTRALRALLSGAFLDAEDPDYTLVRRHERDLAGILQSTFGYQLEVGSTAARASGPPTPDGLRRPIRVPPTSVSGRRRPVDEWPALDDRGCLVLLLTLASLERGGRQIALADLALEVERTGADVDPPITVDFRERRERAAFADGLEILCGWGVLEHTSGSHESYARREQGDDEALFTIDRRRLAMLVRDPAGTLEANTLEALVDESSRYPPTPEGENRARFERLARRLTEDPVLLLDDLDEADRAYFVGQRSRVERAVGAATGYQVERRAEGSAVIVGDRSFTDIPFPTNATVKQVALLLCDTLAATPAGEILSGEAVRDAVHDLIAAHGTHWGREASDPVGVSALTEAATQVLADVGLLRRPDGGGIAPTPLAARFRSPTIRAEGTPR
ncbi:MAG: hypothetical protein QOH12_179 [Solirubrobacteraceae bacterium]|nr:hypothetical protein [Solirubrobacteraceae bacterium]